MTSRSNDTCGNTLQEVQEIRVHTAFSAPEYTSGRLRQPGKPKKAKQDQMVGKESEGQGKCARASIGVVQAPADPVERVSSKNEQLDF
jgi:hypothetical protein